MKKPLLPNAYSIKNTEIIKRIFNNKDVEIYELSNEKFLNIILQSDIDISPSKKDKYNIFNMKIGDKTYNLFVSNVNYSDNVEQLFDKLTKLQGFDAVAGMQELKKELREDVVYPITKKEEYAKFNLTIPNGILLYGPQGCGKTYIVKKLAEEINYNFFELQHSDIASPYIHETVGKISKVFKKAGKNTPAIVFIDELEGLMPSRRNLNGHQYKVEEVNEFLINLNDAGKKNILVIGATNQIELVDEAILRPGRFDKKIKVNPPDIETRKALFQFYLSKMPCENIDFDLLSKITDNYSNSDIEYIVNESARIAINKQLKFVTTEIVKQVLSKTPSSISNNTSKIGFKNN